MIIVAAGLLTAGSCLSNTGLPIYWPYPQRTTLKPRFLSCIKDQASFVQLIDIDPVLVVQVEVAGMCIQFKKGLPVLRFKNAYGFYIATFHNNVRKMGDKQIARFDLGMHRDFAISVWR